MDLLEFDINTLTIGDIEDIEDICGIAYEQIKWDKPSAKLLRAVVYISGRKQNPDFTMQDARNVRAVDFKAGTEANPTTGGDAS